MYFAIMQLELRRIWGLSSYLGVCLLLAVLFNIVAYAVLNTSTQGLNWLGCAFIVLPINQCYQLIFCDSWSQLIRSNDSVDSIRWAFIGISIFLNLPIALSLSLTQQSIGSEILFLWWVLDITGYLLHIIKRIATSRLGRLITYLFWLPTIYPWIIWGQTAQMGDISSTKFILGFWVLFLLQGPIVFSKILKVTAS